MQQALATLPPRVRACMVLRHFDDLTVAQVAETLSLSVGAVKRYLSDGTRALEARLGPVVGRGGADASADHPDDTLVTTLATPRRSR
ncbi:sigma-70 family RNA polymerase sigma factor [Cellulomonas sp. JZ18]|uniref:sigma-70 family RNA polymerase sigma factor n=1 Tax=Cellulomonas sp. JZ18 TaxID=2654191 RepID=UPI001E6538BE|nr:sigma-70 family RNA polymerase sigma factor [Cellulomonas sp. JZ18]